MWVLLCSEVDGNRAFPPARTGRYLVLYAMLGSGLTWSEARRLLYENGKLMSEDIIVKGSPTWESSSEMTFRLSEWAIRRMLGDTAEAEAVRNNADDEGPSFLRSRRDGRRSKRLLSVVEPKRGFSQVELPESSRQAINAALAQLTHRETIFDKWGFGRVFETGRSISFLFWGPPGTGKTLTAEAIAHQLGKNLLIANYAEIESCLVGDAEKNVVQVFATAIELAEACQVQRVDEKLMLDLQIKRAVTGETRAQVHFQKPRLQIRVDNHVET